MSDKYVDPSGNTEQFRAFAHAPEGAAPPAPASRAPLVAGIAVAVVLLVAVVGWLALS